MGRRAAAVWLVLGGCGGGGLPDVPPSVAREDAPRLLADEICRSLFECECSVNPYRDGERCQEVLEQRGTDADQVASQAGLTYDGACVSLLATTRRELGCGVEADEPACIPCRPFFGTGRAGEPCEKLGVTVDVDTCGQGLRCVDRICVELCPTEAVLSLAERCAAGIESLGRCEAGLHCDAGTERCTVSPLVGEPCPDRICTQDAWCDPAAAGSCATRREAGEACVLGDSCVSGRCEDGRCAVSEASVCGLDR